MSKPITVTPGERYGKLSIVRETATKTLRCGKRLRQFLCACECGGTITAALRNLRSGKTASCGCSGVTHGRSLTVEYRTWTAMWQRCTNSRNPMYKHYGQRGIAVCQRWESFESFLADMGLRPPGRRISVERIDNNGNYEPENCRWATQPEQRRNTSKTHFVTFQGETMCLTDLAIKIGMKPSTLFSRVLAYGFTIEEAVSIPVGGRR
jgi:hypothetical protein